MRPKRPAGQSAPTLEVFWPLDAAGAPSRRSYVYLPHDIAQAASISRAARTSMFPLVCQPSWTPRISLIPTPKDAGTGDGEAVDDSDYLQWLVEQDYRTAMAASLEIPTPDRPAHKTLTKLTGLADDSEIARTRLGAAAVQILPVYPRDDGKLSAERPDGLRTARAARHGRGAPPVRTLRPSNPVGP